MTSKQLTKLGKKWQKRLRLQDWTVSYYIVRQFDTRHDVNGMCSFTLSLKSAVIKVVNKVDFDPKLHRQPTQEQILVHELLHLHFANFMDAANERDDVHYKDKEIAIDLIAHALVPGRKK